MTIQPFAPGECTVIPLAHVDHFTDLDDATSERIILVAQRIVRWMRTGFMPPRVGMLVHGYGVPHAHFILVPQHGPYDLDVGSLREDRGWEDRSRVTCETDFGSRP